MSKSSTALLTEDEFGALQQGDEQVFRKVFDAYCGLVQFVVGKCGIADADKDDVVQEVFVRLFKNLKQIEGPEKIKAWLCVTARNRSIDKHRAVRKTDPDELAKLVDENEAYAVFRREIEVELVGTLIDKIGAEDGGKDFVAFYRHGKTAREIAEGNGEAVSTVTTRLSRLRKKFGDMIRTQVEELRQGSPF